MFYAPYLFSILITAFLGWASWFVVLHKLSPFTTPELSLALFFSSFFLALASTFSALIYALRMWITKPKTHKNAINSAFREGALIAFMICMGAIFQRLRVLTWWDALLLVAIILLLEFYFMSRE